MASTAQGSHRGSASAPLGPGSSCLALVLHAHLPFVRHPERDDILEEDWLFEAITESYVPLLQCFERLHDDGVAFQLTMSLSPPLLGMLGDELLRRRYDQRLNHLRQLVRRELVRTTADPDLQVLARHYADRLDEVDRCWQAVDGDLVAPLRRLQQQGHLDLLTSAATHGYLPLLAVNPQAVWAQIKVGVDYYEQVLGQPPKGFWLPECGYAPGIDKMLARAGIRYAVAETHALLDARPRARFKARRPVFSVDSGIALFGRDPQSAEQVWSRNGGYPADPVYRDFYRDIGFDLPREALGGLAHHADGHRFTGIKYHRITGDGRDKDLYHPEIAEQRAAQHARDFVHKRLRDLSGVRSVIPAAMVVAPYDAELFGHWWYEGPRWLEETIRETARLPAGALQLTHLRGYLQAHATHQLVRPAPSSWGDGGYNQYWLDPTNSWVYPRLHQAADQMVALARRFAAPTNLERRALNQAARQLLLAQSSDWTFIMRSDTAVEYAEERIERHLACFDRLVDQLDDSVQLDLDWLEQSERRDNLFPAIDYRVYADGI